MIAVDTNVLVYAHREDSQWFEVASERLAALAEGRALWAIPWPCLHEFLAIVTHPKIYNPSTPVPKALAQIEAWLESPSLTLLSEAEGYGAVLGRLLREGKIRGPRVHDARIAALCIQHGVRQLWSADRDFSRFDDLSVKNPLLEG